MSTYATLAQVKATDAARSWPADDVLAALISQAERDVDSLLPTAQPYEDTGLKLRPDQLAGWMQAALQRAVGAQVAWLIDVPARERSGVKDAPVTSLKGPDFEVAYAVSLTTAGVSRPQTGDATARELEPLVNAFPRFTRGRP